MSVLVETRYKSLRGVPVGGGTAGCVLANRLTADPKLKVALIEAGDDELNSYMTEIPVMAAELQKTDNDWQYQTVPQAFGCGSMVDQVSSFRFLPFSEKKEKKNPAE